MNDKNVTARNKIVDALTRMGGTITKGSKDDSTGLVVGIDGIQVHVLTDFHKRRMVELSDSVDDLGERAWDRRPYGADVMKRQHVTSCISIERILATVDDDAIDKMARRALNTIMDDAKIIRAHVAAAFKSDNAHKSLSVATAAALGIPEDGYYMHHRVSVNGDRVTIGGLTVGSTAAAGILAILKEESQELARSISKVKA